MQFKKLKDILHINITIITAVIKLWITLYNLQSMFIIHTDPMRYYIVGVFAYVCGDTHRERERERENRYYIPTYL